ncbi:hypothetical protein [Dyadobacter sp. CY323]|uniref:hypothetical protein n=1 Tax=Dyadobacter sp. CY323 TaxID=2907302 RepID=UPI001F45C737|nr:hypothetical protein [Dyadobacter sp. CY323]MCE6992652.1 hypothetical protein [Dyadobacter sp. CY323]
MERRVADSICPGIEKVENFEIGDPIPDGQTVSCRLHSNTIEISERRNRGLGRRVNYLKRKPVLLHSDANEHLRDEIPCLLGRFRAFCRNVAHFPSFPKR